MLVAVLKLLRGMLVETAVLFPSFYCLVSVRCVCFHLFSFVYGVCSSLVLIFLFPSTGLMCVWCELSPLTLIQTGLQMFKVLCWHLHASSNLLIYFLLLSPAPENLWQSKQFAETARSPWLALVKKAVMVANQGLPQASTWDVSTVLPQKVKKCKSQIWELCGFQAWLCVKTGIAKALFSVKILWCTSWL